MKIAIGLLIAPFLAAAAVTGASVAEHFGNIEFSDGTGFTKELTSDHKSGRPALSPDGRTVVWIHLDGPASQVDAGASSVWVADALTGAVRRLAGDTGDRDLQVRIVNPQSASFSLDGGYIYVTSDLAAVSPGIHQIKLATGQQRFVIEGALATIIRTGPYRGYLIVGQHRYYATKTGSYEAAYVVRPDGKVMFEVPGTNDSDANPRPDAVTRWLATKGWKAW